MPIGDRLPYDLVFVVQNKFVKVQAKSAWFDEAKQNYVVDNRKTKTNRRIIQHAAYQEEDFDIALLFIEALEVFYVMLIAVFLSYGSEIHLIESEKRQRKPRSSEYREKWNLISEAQREQDSSLYFELP